MPRHPPIALKTLDRSHCQCPSVHVPEDRRSEERYMDHQKDRGEPQAFKRWHWHKKTSFSRSVRGPRSGKPISCRELSVPGDEPPALPPGRKQGAMHPLRPGSAGGTRTNLLFTMSCRTGGEHEAFRKLFSKWMNGGAGRDRTDDPLLAKQVLSQLSYGPSLSSLRRPRARRPCGCFASDRRKPANLAAEHGGPGRT